MPSPAPRRPGSRARVTVTVTAPDGESGLTRGLAAWLTRAAPATARGEVTVALVSDARMRTLNRSFRNKDYATDVLSFPTAASTPAASTAARPVDIDGRRLPQPGARSLGDIVIATGVARRQADEAGHSVATELKVLALHGLLHLLGYDHTDDDGLMARTEARLRRKAGLDAGLIERAVTRPSGKRRS
jgi:probable rRNA maturation factor